MIVDCHTHLWADAHQLGKGAEAMLLRAGVRGDCCAGPAEHRQAAVGVDRTLVFAYRCAATGGNVPNDYVADYVASSDGKMLAVAAADPADGPTRPIEALLVRREFAGVVVDPAGGDFHPTDSRIMPLYEAAAALGKCVFFQHGADWAGAGRMAHARPVLLEDIAAELPTLTIVIASMGFPWVTECLALLARRPRVFADVAALVRRPWQAYHALVLAHQFNVTDKILFGSDFPFSTAAAAIEGLYRLQEVTQGTNLPTVPRETLRSIIERRALTALGLGGDQEPAPAPAEQAEEETYWPLR
ncbi:MAG: amidohydrolase family protein [Phycisphaerae bacterium]|nr:amidohydrolase family protein [Phycisphaerae bacterium]